MVREALLPEKWLNLVILCEAVAYKAMSGLGTLATVWATVVLLGGFSTLVKQTDFWYITIIAFLQTIGIFGGYEDPAHQFFMRAPDALRRYKKGLAEEHGVSWRRREEEPHQTGGRKRAASRQDKEEVGFLGMDKFRSRLGTIFYLGFMLTQLAAVTTLMALSYKRLMKQDYVDQQYQGHDDHRNIRRSLNIFYELVLAQGIIFTLLLLNPLTRMQVVELQREYMLFGRSGRDIVHRYKNDSYMEFIMGNVRPTLYMDLVTFAKNLVVSSSIDDQLLGVRTIDRILRSFAGGKTSNKVLARLQASLDPEATSTLVSMLGLAINIDDEEDIRGHAARLVLRIAPGLMVESFPRILNLISSLLSTEKEMTRDMDLVWFGLRILDKLTDNPENCRQAKDSDDLLSKIIDLTNLCGHAAIGGRTSESWMKEEVLPLLLAEEEIPTSFQKKIDEEIIVGMSLNVLGKLLAAPGKAGKELRCKTFESVHFHRSARIISAHVEAARVISCLAMDDKPKTEIGRFPDIIKMLKNCLHPNKAHANMNKVAAKLLLLEYASSEQLHEIQLLRNHILDENQGVLPPVLAILEELDLKYLDVPRRVNRIIQKIDLEDLHSAPRVNTAEAAAQALVMLSTGSTSTGCQENIEAILEELNNEEELQEIVNMLSAKYGEKRRSTEINLEQYHLSTKMFQAIMKIVCTEDRDNIRSMVAKLMQNLRGYAGAKDFKKQMDIIDKALPEVLKSIIQEVVRLESAESTSESMVKANDELRIKEGKVLESLISLAAKIFSSMDARDVIKTLEDPNITVCLFVQKLKKVLEVYKSPITAYPRIRKSTIELMNWMIRNNSSYIEILLQCGVYEQLEVVIKTARKLENFELFYYDVGIGHHETPISSLAMALRDQLSLSPKFQERTHCYREHESSISVVLIA